MSSARWLLGLNGLIAGLSGFETEITSNALGDLITPSNVRSKELTDKGSAVMQAIRAGSSAISISASLKRLYAFSVQDGAGQSFDLTRLNKDICGETGFKTVAYQKEPEPRLWVVRHDGVVAVATYNPTEQVVAWSRMVFDGEVEAVCCLPDGDEDAVYFIVKRTIDGAAVRYVEKLAPENWTDIEDAIRLHCSVSYEGAATNTFTGLDHLEGEQVYCWGDGQLLGPYAVSGGSITIDVSVKKAIVGLLYQGKYKSARLAWGREGSSIAAWRKLGDMNFVLHRTAGGCLAWGDNYLLDEGEMTRLADRIDDGSLVYDGPVQVFDGDVASEIVGENSPDPRLHILMTGGGPATILGIATGMQNNG